MSDSKLRPLTEEQRIRKAKCTGSRIYLRLSPGMTSEEFADLAYEMIQKLMREEDAPLMEDEDQMEADGDEQATSE